MLTTYFKGKVGCVAYGVVTHRMKPGLSRTLCINRIWSIITNLFNKMVNGGSNLTLNSWPQIN